jgi:hypothetical protein
LSTINNTLLLTDGALRWGIFTVPSGECFSEKWPRDGLQPQSSNTSRVARSAVIQVNNEVTIHVRIQLIASHQAIHRRLNFLLMELISQRKTKKLMHESKSKVVK